MPYWTLRISHTVLATLPPRKSHALEVLDRARKAVERDFEETDEEDDAFGAGGRGGGEPLFEEEGARDPPATPSRRRNR